MSEDRDKKEAVTYTLRLREDLKSRLERTASKKGWSLNQLILDIIDRHYQAAGFVEARRLTSKAGRLYEVRVDVSNPHPPDEPTCFFFIDDPKREKEINYYTIGLSRSLLRDWRVREQDWYEVIEEVGLALLSFYNAAGRELGFLMWNQYPEYPRRRVIYSHDLPIDNHSQEQFLKLLKIQSWSDKNLMHQIITNQGIWTAQGKHLGYWAGQDVFFSDGRHVGRIYSGSSGERRVYNLLGEYLGDIYQNRLLINRVVNRYERKSVIPEEPRRAPSLCEPLSPWDSCPEPHLPIETCLEAPVTIP